MAAKLIERGSSPGQAREIPLTGAEFLIGRGTDCDLRLPLSAISRHHCMIQLKNGEATLMDLGSSNGTFLNGQRVRSPMPLHTGDEIRLDQHTFVIDLGDTPGLNLAGGADANAATCRVRPPVAKSKP